MFVGYMRLSFLNKTVGFHPINFQIGNYGPSALQLKLIDVGFNTRFQHCRFQYMLRRCKINCRDTSMYKITYKPKAHSSTEHNDTTPLSILRPLFPSLLHRTRHYAHCIRNAVPVSTENPLTLRRAPQVPGVGGENKRGMRGAGTSSLTTSSCPDPSSSVSSHSVALSGCSASLDGGWWPKVPVFGGALRSVVGLH